MCASFDSAASDNFNDLKSADFFEKVADAVVIVVPASSLQETLVTHQRLLRRISRMMLEDKHIPDKYVFILHSPVENEDLKKCEEMIATSMQTLLQDTALSLGLSADVPAISQELSQRLCIFSLPSILQLDTYNTSKRTVRQSLLALPGSDISSQRGSLVERLSAMKEQWRQIPSPPEHTLSSSQLQSLFEIEEAYLVCVAQAGKTLDRWRTRLNSPTMTSLLPSFDTAFTPTVGRFGAQAVGLLDDMRSRFLTYTRGAVMVKERTTRLAQLLRLISSEVASLFRIQIQSLQFDAERRMRKELFRLAGKPVRSATSLAESGVQDTGGLDNEAIKVKNTILQEFKTRTAPLEVPSLGLVVSDDVMASLSASLEQMCKEFPSSAAARALSMQQLEREVKDGVSDTGDPDKVSKRRGFRAALTLVGMFRPPGLGNMQGVLSNTEPFLLGGILPVSFVLGVQNDADTPEVLGDDRDLPWLRLQPKIHFDIDL